MSDEQVETVEENQETGGNTPAVAIETEKPADHMIPKARFDEVNSKLKQLLAAQEQVEAERQQADEARLVEQNKFKELYEAEKVRAVEAAQKVAEIERQNLARQVAQDAGIPQMWQRLQGTTKEEFEADAASLLELIPKPQAPSLDSGKTGRGAGPTQQEINEMAVRLRVSPKHLAAQYTG